jgi:HK97 family phage major capsid protein
VAIPSDATINDGLLPINIASEFIRSLQHTSVAMALGTVRQLPAGTTRFPSIASLPAPAWLASSTAQKPSGWATFSSQDVVPEELAVIVILPLNTINDLSFDVWAQIEPDMRTKFAQAIDAAVIFGTAAPPSFYVGGIVAHATAGGNTAVLPATITASADAASTVDTALSAVEADGYDPSGFGANVKFRSTVRNARNLQGDLIYQANPTAGAPSTLYGLPVYYESGAGWSDLNTLAIPGDWSKLIIGVRQDISVAVSDDATLMDGATPVSMFERDSRAFRMTMRLGAAIVNPSGAGKSPFGAIKAT